MRAGATQPDLCRFRRLCQHTGVLRETGRRFCFGVRWRLEGAVTGSVVGLARLPHVILKREDRVEIHGDVRGGAERRSQRRWHFVVFGEPSFGAGTVSGSFDD